MSQDYLEILEAFKHEIAKDYDESTVDTMLLIEEANPELTKDSRRYKDSQKVIFKQYISDSNAKELIDLVNNTANYNINNLIEYKTEILNKCNILNAIGENPVEMLIYSTKGLYGQPNFINSVRDLVKNIYEENQEVVRVSYSSILTNWKWNDCLQFVLKSISELNILDLEDEVYQIIENNNINRELAANTLISIGADKYYESMINFLCAQPNETSTEKEILRETLYKFARQNESNTVFIYKCYLELNLKNQITNILIGAIRFNLNKTILDHVEKNLKNPQVSTQISNKMIRLLGKCRKDNQELTILLRNALDYSYLNKGEVIRALGEEAGSLQLDTIKDKRKTLRERANAIIELGKYDDGNDDILLTVASESELLNAVVCSAMVERGNIKQVIPLFEYIVKRDDNDEVSIEAKNQVKRLRGLRNEELNNHLMKVAQKLLQNDELPNINKVMKILDLFSSGMTTDEVGELFLEKLITTKHSIVKNKILQFFRKEFNRFNFNLKKSIKDSVVKCTKEKDVSEEAMNSLKAINSFVDLTPNGGIAL